MTQIAKLQRSQVSSLSLVISAALFVATWLTRGTPLLALSLSAVGIASWSYVELGRYISNLWLRRALKALPYFMPVLVVGIDLHGTFLGIAVGIALGATLLALQWKSLRVALDRRLLGLMPRPTRTEALTESMFFLLPSIAQEYYHRQAWLSILILHIGVWPWAAVAFTSVMFSVEHLIGRGGHTTPSRMNLIRWFGMGVLLSTAVLLTGQIWPAIICHAMVNSPAAIQPHLRGKL